MRYGWRHRFVRHAAVALLLCSSVAIGDSGVATEGVAVRALPHEAREVLRRAQHGGPYRYDRDGAAFGNYERLLPARRRGFYREYTVDTPGVGHRGARRLVIGCHRKRATDAPVREPAFAGFRDCAGPAEVYYTDDHYRSFRRVFP